MSNSNIEMNLPEAEFKRWDIPLKMGLIIGLVSVILSVVNYMFALPKSYIAFMVLGGVTFVALLVLYGITGARQRKAMGGYITIKDAFAAIFVAILVSSLISTIWGIVYAKLIDPSVAEKVKAGTLEFMQRMHAPQEKLDETAAEMDKQLTNSLSPGVLLYSYAKSLITLSFFGFIAAFIVRRKPKQDLA